jgi:DNA replication protein DnaC
LSLLLGFSQQWPKIFKRRLLAKDLDDFQFEGTPINETLVNDLVGGGFIAQQRNAVLVGGTGTAKTHLAIAIARSCIRSGSRGRFYNVVDLVNRLEIETRNGRQGRIADRLSCVVSRKVSLRSACRRPLQHRRRILP